MKTAAERQWDVILWGATGFTGRLVAEHLLQTYGTGGELRWTIAGRDRAKLEAVRRDLGVTEPTALPLLVADAADAAAMAELAGSTRVVCSTVGPYAKYGSPLVAACVAAGTDYCDLTGEVPWMRRMIDAHQEAAASSGARIVFTCGFDCIPADLGVFFLQQEMRARHAVVSPRIRFRMKGAKGGASGGTIASALNMMDEASRDRSVRRVVGDPYGLNPTGERQGPDGSDLVVPAWDDTFGEWVGPFVMAGVDTRVVRRTNALLGYPWGREFRYDEAVLMGRGPVGWARAAGMTAGLGAGLALLQASWGRRLASRWLPAPGEGPSPEQRETGYFDIRLRGEHPSDPSLYVVVRVTGDRDPGYGSTAKMLGQSAACLALDGISVPGGCWTPAAALGEALLRRLPEKAGVRFEVM